MEAFFIGDVRDVIFSRVNKLTQIPLLFNGFGACGLDNSVTVGEGIIFRGNITSTPPNSNAGSDINFRIPNGKAYSPFFIGWNGSHSLVLNFNVIEKITLKQLFQDVFSTLQTSKICQNYQYVFLEIVGLFHPEDIFDRALQKRVDRDEKLTTAPENSKEYFKPRIIYNDLVKRNEINDNLLPLCIVGAGHLCEEYSSNGQNLCENIFYVSPQEMEKPVEKKEKDGKVNLLTHSHALGWRGSNSNIESLLSLIRKDVQAARDFNVIDDSVNKLLEYHPDYLVHLDDWSLLKTATVKVFFADPADFIVRSLSENTD